MRMNRERPTQDGVVQFDGKDGQVEPWPVAAATGVRIEKIGFANVMAG